MTMTAEPPTLPNGNPPIDERSDSARSTNAGSRLRYAAKIARRELRRRPWRATLVVILIALPTWAMLNLAIQMRTGIAADRHPGTDFSSDLVVPFNDQGSTDSGEAAVSTPALVYGVSISASTTAEIERALPDGTSSQRVIGGYTSIMDADGVIRSATFMKLDLATGAAATWAPLVEGRAPEAGEVVLGETLAHDIGVGVGDTVTLRHPEGHWLVSGVASRYTDANLMAVRDFDESLLAIDAGVLLVDLPADASAADAERLEVDLGAYAPATSRFAVDYGSADDVVAPVAITWLAAIMLFLMFGVIIVAAFATIARGQLVTVGQLAANGATGRFTRMVMASQGSWAGLVGVAIGGIATLATLPLVAPAIRDSTWTPVSLTWNPLDVIAIAVIGVGVATAAAVLPAFALVRTSVLDALAGRRPERAVPKWMVPVGVASFGLGLLLLVVSATSASDASILGGMLGSLAMVIGVCLVGPLVIDLASRTASVMPLSIRISLRGLGRARLRSASVVSSIAVTTGVMAVIIAGMETDVGGPLPGEHADNVVVVAAYPSAEMRTPDGAALLDSDLLPIGEPEVVDLRWLPATPDGAADEVRRILPEVTEHPLRVALRPDGVYDNRDGQMLRAPNVEEEEYLVPGGGGFASMVSVSDFEALPLIADETTLDAFTLPDSFRTAVAVAGVARAVPASNCFEDGEISDTWDGEPVEASSDAAASLEEIASAPIAVPGMECSRWFGPFMTEQFALDHGFQIEQAGTVLANPQPILPEQRNEIISDYKNPSIFANWEYEGAAAYTELAVTESSLPANSWQTAPNGISMYWPNYTTDAYRLLWLTVFGVAAGFVTLIAGIGLALAATDSRRDRAVLSVIGAGPATQRRVAATDAWVLVVIGTLLGVPAALFASWVITVASRQDTPTGVPWLFVAAEFVVIPLFVAGCAYLAGLLRRTKRPMSVLQVD